MAGEKKITTSKQEISERKILPKELPYYNYTGSLTMHYGQFNNSVMEKNTSQQNMSSKICLASMILIYLTLILY